MMWLATATDNHERPILEGKHPSWGPSGDRFAYVAAGTEGRRDVFEVTLDGAIVNLTRSGGAESRPAWAPDGSTIAFARGVADETEIVVLDVVSGSQTVLPGSEGARAPTWSPVGDRIAFTRDTGDADALFVADRATGAVEQLDTSGLDVGSAAWSPDDDVIALAGSTGGETDLFMLDMATGSVEQITHDDAIDAHPRWSPDGTSLYFSKREGAKWISHRLEVATRGIVKVGLRNASEVTPQPCLSTCAETSLERRSSAIRLSLTKRSLSVRAQGTIKHVSAGRVFLLLEERRKSRFASYSSTFADIDGEGFTRSLDNPYSGECRVRVAFPGGMGVMPERQKETFDCYRPPSGSRPGDLHVVKGSSPASGPGPVRRFKIAVERRTEVYPPAFADVVEKILYDRRSWGGGGHLGMKRVDSGDADIVVTLATPKTVDRLCAPLATEGKYSCWNGSRAVINVDRWLQGSNTYKGRRRQYRRYLINHEVGHGLGHGHRQCPAGDAARPVMMQQTGSLKGCGRAWWPAAWEKDATPGAGARAIPRPDSTQDVTSATEWLE